jgi:hypothetical protein
LWPWRSCCGAASTLLPDEPQARGQTGGLSDELAPYVDRSEAETFDRVGELLRSQRPDPGSGFVSELDSSGDALPARRDGPSNLSSRVLLALLAGLILLGLALLGASGSGPLG